MSELVFHQSAVSLNGVSSVVKTEWFCLHRSIFKTYFSVSVIKLQTGYITRGHKSKQTATYNQINCVDKQTQGVGLY